MAIRIRTARPDDAEFLAWVVMAAARSHLERGAWDLAIEGDDDRKLGFLRTLLTSEKPHWCHHGGFLVAEVDGEPAAALSGYAARDAELQDAGQAIAEAAAACGFSDDEVAAGFARMAVFLGCLPEDAPGAWIVEWVATRPAHRGRGLVQELLAAELDEGRRRGHELAQIMLLSGNTPAQRAYERSGFRYVDERRSAAFEEALGSPGVLRMLRPL